MYSNFYSNKIGGEKYKFLFSSIRIKFRSFSTLLMLKLMDMFPNIKLSFLWANNFVCIYLQRHFIHMQTNMCIFFIPFIVYANGSIQYKLFCTMLFGFNNILWGSSHIHTLIPTSLCFWRHCILPLLTSPVEVHLGYFQSFVITDNICSL